MLFAAADAVNHLRDATCKTTPATPPAPGTTPHAGSRAVPSGRRSARPGSPPHRFLDPEGRRALEHIALHRQLGVLLAQPVELIAFALTERALAVASTPIQIHPPAQRALVQAQLPNDLRDRPARLPHDPDRAFSKLPIEISPYHRHHFLQGDVSTVRGEAQGLW